jgi:hypothetical protein
MSERKERVTLEVTHSESDRLGSASSWEWQTMADATIGQDAESLVEVRVVQEGRLTDAQREAVAWAIAVTCTMPHDAIGPIQRERLRDLIARHGRDA